MNKKSGLSDNDVFRSMGIDPTAARSLAESFGMPFTQDDVDEEWLNREDLEDTQEKSK